MGREEQAEEKETLQSIFPDELTGKPRKLLLERHGRVDG